LKDIRAAPSTIALTSLALAGNAGAGDLPKGGVLPADPGSTVGVAYEAPSRCPDASAFVERLRARTSHGDLAPSSEVARFIVIVSSTQAASSARIEFSGADSQPVTRTVSGRTCEEVVSAAALITALAIEATLGGAPAVIPEATEPAATSPPVRDTVVAPSPGEPRSIWLRGGGLGASGGLDSWTPGGGYAWGVFGELAGRAPLVFARLTLRGTAGSTSVEARSATFTSLMARLSLCPFSLQISEPISLIPCAAIDVGRLTGQGEASAELRTPRSAAILWSAAEAVLLVRWQLGDLVAIEAGGELGFPLVRHTFVFEWPTRLVYEVPALGAGAYAAVALRFH
jgi:hypothetical protein